MIHKIIVIDQRTTVGQLLFDDGIVLLETDLLTGFISAISAFAQCLGEKSVEFKGADLGDNRFSLITRDYLTYAVFQDMFDNEPYAQMMLKEIIDTYHEELLLLNLSMDQIRKAIPDEIKNFLRTDFFPNYILKDISFTIEEKLTQMSINFDLVFLSSINNGIIEVWRRPINPAIMQQFLDIISKIPLKMNWTAEEQLTNSELINNPKNESDFEAWIIKRISTTNFFLAGRAIAKHKEIENCSNIVVSKALDEIALIIEKALEKDWINAS